MYFWNVGDLKRRLMTGGLSAPESLKYLIAFAILLLGNVQGVRVSGVSTPTMAIIEALDLVAAWLIALLGTIFCYFQNGASEGKSFLERYLSLSWVVALRITVASMPLVFVLWPTVVIASKRDPDVKPS